MLKPKLPQQDQGFTLVEVLVAILITTLFVAVAMQSMVIAAIFKAKAQEYSEATTWIQEDLENVKYQASQLGIKNIQSMISADEFITISNHGFASGDPVIFVGDGTIAGGLSKNTTYYVRDVTTNTFKVASTAGGAAIDLTSDSTGSLSSIATSRCNATRTTGYADGLRDLITGSDQTGNTNDVYNPPSSGNNQTRDITLKSKFTNKTFRLTRTTTIPDTTPYNVLQVSYTVSPIFGGTFGAPVANFYTEVIPNAAFQCP